MTVYQWIEYHMCPARAGTAVNGRMFRDCVKSCSDPANVSVKLPLQLQTARVFVEYTMSLREELSHD